MIKDHIKLEKLLEKLEISNKEDFGLMKDAFIKFERELQKHIFTEENAIFVYYSPLDLYEGYRMLPELTKQHNYIINRLNNWRDDIKKNRILVDIYGFKEFLLRHRIFEEEKVYPKLEKELSLEHKKIVFRKINEFLR
jgi:hemerythrin-like domain-containing protein